MFQVVLWRVRYKLSLRDLAEMFWQRGFSFTHETVRDREVRFGPQLAEHLRHKRHRHAGWGWYGDETYIAGRANGRIWTAPSTAIGNGRCTAERAPGSGGGESIL